MGPDNRAIGKVGQAMPLQPRPKITANGGGGFLVRKDSSVGTSGGLLKGRLRLRGRARGEGVTPWKWGGWPEPASPCRWTSGHWGGTGFPARMIKGLEFPELPRWHVYVAGALPLLEMAVSA